MFLKSIGNFRGLAIIMIVAGHLYGYGFSDTDVLGAIIKNIITGGTALFVFISGFMFHYVFFKRYEYKKFMVNKIKNVGVPYFLLASLAIFMLFVVSSGYFQPIGEMTDPLNAYRNGILFNPGDSSFLVTLKYYATGRFLTAYWYIPFALVLFACAPMHIKFIELNIKKQLMIVIALSVVSIVVHRPVAGTNPLHSLVYYTPTYLMGIMFSMYNIKVKGFLYNKIPLLLVSVVLISYLEYCLGHIGNYSKPFFEFGGLDLQYIQKILLISLFYISLERWEFSNKVIDTISDTSFAIFFIHPWVMVLISKVLNRFYPEFSGVISLNVPLYVATTSFVILASVCIAVLIKAFFKGSKKTRYLIGY